MPDLTLNSDEEFTSILRTLTSLVEKCGWRFLIATTLHDMDRRDAVARFPHKIEVRHWAP